MSDRQPPYDPSTAPTRPAQRVPTGYATTEREPLVQTKEQADETAELVRLQAEHPGAPAWGLTILVRTNSTAKAVDRLEQRADESDRRAEEHERRIGVLERPPMRPQQVTLSGLEEEDVESRGSLSADQRLQSIERAQIRQRRDTRRATNTQTAAIIGALIALATAGSQYLAAQARETAAQTERAAEKAAREAAAEAARVTKGTP